MPVRSWVVNASSTACREAAGIDGESQLEVLFRAHFERITRVIGRVIEDQARAEEVAVDVFLKWKRNPQAWGQKAEGWLYRAATREAIDEWRRQARRQRFERLASWFRAAPRNPEQEYEAGVQARQVRATLAALKQRDAEALLLWAEGFGYREISEALECNFNNTGSVVSRAQDAFRKEYVKRYGKES